MESKLIVSSIQNILLLSITVNLLFQFSSSEAKENEIEESKFSLVSEIHIISEVNTLKVRCKSKDDDLGNRTLTQGNEFMWKFKENAYGTTLFFCHFYWNAKEARFNVFDGAVKDNCSMRKFLPNYHCFWKVTDNAFYISKNNMKYTLLYTW
ncbi:S-protein homolog 3-like [Impatiens glandulifera]|uniref:S-protein homolog 3-like n=1 Tax=Impatiens glandulifera TaxID=253017 RepID=UPI001FB055E3|nr:S-protein homolog 3-like [Impatiens glandulifera]